MKKFDATTRLNIKVISILAIFIVLITLYSQWLSLQEEKNKYANQLSGITCYLVHQMPAKSFSEILAQHGGSTEPVDRQVMIINQEIQPILGNMFIPDKAIVYGVYSRQLQKVVAIGPNFDKSLLVTGDLSLIEQFYENEAAQFGEIDNSIVWYGAPVFYHVRTISYQGEVIGHVFASVNLGMIQQQVWNKTIKTLLGSFVGLMIVIMLFQEAIIALKKELQLFAESIVKGQGKNFESEVPELTPVLHYISEQTEKMARLDRLNLIGEMAASIGHEVRNPMTTVRGFLQYLGKKESLSTYRSQFMLMVDELDRANSIITEFLSLAKNKRMDFKELDLNQVIGDVMPLIEVDALRYNCTIRQSLQKIPLFLADESSMRQLLLNLVRNAIEAMPQGGDIELCTKCQKSQVLLIIRDQGNGIAPDILEKLGTPFFTTKEKGTGLGLAVCYRIVQRHNAVIQVESEVNKGTCFTISFNC